MTTREDILSLAPCPFCGGDNVTVSGPYGWYNRWCISHSCSSFYCGTSEFAGEFPSKQAAADAWNRRAAPTPPAAEAPGQEPVAVKPLEWASEPPYSVARVSNLNGHYAVEAWYDDDGGCHVDLIGSFLVRNGAFSSVADAKAAAQADYEQRIRSALVSATPTYADAEAKGWRATADWTVSQSENAGRILTNLGFGTDASLEPYADRRRDNLAMELEASFQDGKTEGIEAAAMLVDDYAPDDVELATAIRSLASPAPKEPGQ